MSKKILTLFLFFQVLVAAATAQSLTGAELAGKWTVTEVRSSVEHLPENELVTLELMKKHFLQSSFTFNADNSFSLDIPLEELKLPHGNWKIDAKTGIIAVLDPGGDGSRFLEIESKKKEGKILFLIQETPLELEMKKE